jgi:hypothetical protein
MNGRKKAKIRIIAIGLSICLSVFVGSVEATDYFVSSTGNNTNSGLSEISPWQLISYALGWATNGDTIRLAEGEYPERLNITKAITLIGTNIYEPTNPPFSRNISRTIIRPPDDLPDSAVIRIETNDVSVRYLTINGDFDTNGFPDAKFGIYCTNGPTTVDHCLITNMLGYGILSLGCLPPSPPGDTESSQGYFGYNTIANITHASPGMASGIFMDRAPADCEFNDIASITGLNARAGIYIYHCYYTSNMTNSIRVNNNYFQNCLMGLWANRPCYSGSKINIYGNTATNGLIGIRVSAARGPAIISSNTISVSGLSPSGTTPARGIWVQADYDPWGISNSLNRTDHPILGNRISGHSTNADGTVGMMFEYDSLISDSTSNGVRATVVSNFIDNFDYGLYIKG